MLPRISKCKQSDSNDGIFSIIIPTWNNLSYLQLCLRSIRENSTYRHQIIILVNEGADGTVEWLQSQHDVDYVLAENNIGICMGLNICRSLVGNPYIVYANDDMYFLPAWDQGLYMETQHAPDKHFMLSSTMIEPSGNNPCCLIHNFGTDIESFREKELLDCCNQFTKENWSGASWPPSLIPTDTWDLVGGMSIEFSPGMYSDPDLSRKLWEIGVRYFKGVGNSFVYHFGSKSTKRIRKNKGKKQFLAKWGITARFFYQHYLKLGQPFDGTLPDIPSNDKSEKLHRLFH